MYANLWQQSVVGELELFKTTIRFHFILPYNASGIAFKTPRNNEEFTVRRSYVTTKSLVYTPYAMFLHFDHACLEGLILASKHAKRAVVSGMYGDWHFRFFTLLEEDYGEEAKWVADFLLIDERKKPIMHLNFPEDVHRAPRLYVATPHGYTRFFDTTWTPAAVPEQQKPKSKLYQKSSAIMRPNCALIARRVQAALLEHPQHWPSEEFAETLHSFLEYFD
jgi:hypothetical protein